MESELKKYREAVSSRFKHQLEPLNISEFQAKCDSLRIWFTTDIILGKGAYGVVHPGLWYNKGVKEIPMEIVVKHQYDDLALTRPDRVVSEVNLSQRVAHAHLAKTFFVLGPIIDDDPKNWKDPIKISKKERDYGGGTEGLIIVFERYHGPDIEHYIEDISIDEHEPAAMIKNTMNQMLAALDYLFRQYISHKDIGPQNVMFDRHGTVKLIDMGLAVDVTEDVPPEVKPKKPKKVIHPELLAFQQSPDVKKQQPEVEKSMESDQDVKHLAEVTRREKETKVLKMPGFESDTLSKSGTEKVRQIFEEFRNRVAAQSGGPKPKEMAHLPSKPSSPTQYKSSAENYSHWLKKDRAKNTWSEDLNDTAALILFMNSVYEDDVEEESEDLPEWFVSDPQMLVFYKALKSSAQKLQSDEQANVRNPIPQLLDHPWLRFDPIEITFRQTFAMFV